MDMNTCLRCLQKIFNNFSLYKLVLGRGKILYLPNLNQTRYHQLLLAKFCNEYSTIILEHLLHLLMQYRPMLSCDFPPSALVGHSFVSDTDEQFIFVLRSSCWQQKVWQQVIRV